MSAPPGATATTIAAVATPPGHGAIGIIRVSGPRARQVALDRFTASKTGFTDFTPYRLHHGRFHDGQGQILDEVLTVFMPGPGSFTGEDVVEIHCHGSPAVLQGVLEALLDQGVHPAGPGEFTQRAFLNGRIDLTQAEAVAEIISATSPAASLLAQTKLSGALQEWLQALRTNLEQLRAQLCLAVDFPEEDIECLAPPDFSGAVQDLQKQIRALLANRRQNRIWNDGALCVLSGPVNAGKSSLLNLLLGRRRALVSPEPGTTRDFLEERLIIDGLGIRLVDTAGLRRDAGALEQAGLSLAQEIQDTADLILLVTDNASLLDETLENGESIPLTQRFPKEMTLVLANKSDLPPANPEPARHFAALGHDVVHVSAKTGQGLENLLRAIRSKLTASSPKPRPDCLTPNLRQSLALHRADQELNLLQEEIAQNVPYDLLGVRLESVCAILAEITGEISSAEVLDSIFSQFCIGK